MTDKQAEKLKRGDLILCIGTGNNLYANFTVGKIYEIGGDYFNNIKCMDNKVAVKYDDFNRLNAWRSAYFVKVTSKSSKAAKLMYLKY